MSLEVAIQENTAVLRELITVLTTDPRVGGTPVKKTETPKPAPVKTAATPKEDTAPVAQMAAKEIPYAEVAKLTLTIVQTKGKPAAMDIFKEYKIANAKELKTEQYAGYIERLKKAQKELPDINK